MIFKDYKLSVTENYLTLHFRLIVIYFISSKYFDLIYKKENSLNEKQHELAEILYKTKNINFIKMFIDDIGIYPVNMESLIVYIDQMPLDKQIISLFNKIFESENKINKFEDELKLTNDRLDRV